MARMIAAWTVILLYVSGAHSEEPLAFLDRAERQAAKGDVKGVFRLCPDWCAKAGASPQLARKNLIDALKAEYGDVPYRWDATLFATRPEVWHEISGAEFVAARSVNVRSFRDRPWEVLLREKSLRFDEKEWPREFGDRSPVPFACLDGNRCYLIAHLDRRLEVQSIDIDSEKPIWTTSVPLISGSGGIAGGSPQDRFLDASFVNRNQERRLLLWHHFMGEFAFIAISTNSGNIDCWWSSKIDEFIKRDRP